MNILFIYTSAIVRQNGGVQRVTSVLGEYFVTKHHKVYYLSLKKGSTPINNHYSLPNESRLDCEANYQYYKHIVLDKSIDIIINQSALGGGMSEFCAYVKPYSKAKILSVIHNSLLGNLDSLASFKSKYRKFKFFFNALDHTLIKFILKKIYTYKYKKKYVFTYESSDKVILLSNNYIKELEAFIGKIKLDKVISIPNPCTLVCNQQIDKKKNEILYVGRLNSSQKRLDLLLDIWAEFSAANDDWKLLVLGDGEERVELESKSRQMELKRISFLGNKNPTEFYAKAKILCMTSAYEGFPLVLAEAQSFGLVPILFNSFASASDIIQHEVNGLLINPFDKNEYLIQLNNLAHNKDKFRMLSSNAKKNVDKYTIDEVGEQWLSTFIELYK